jgi:predicted Zn-dependent peptidase
MWLQDFLFQYRAGIEAVTGESVRSAAGRHLHPGQQVVVVVGDAVQVRPQLMAAGFKVLPLKLQQQL